MKIEEPKKEIEITFYPYSIHLTNARFGIAIPEKRIVILNRTEISFDDIQYWMKIPALPK